MFNREQPRQPLRITANDVQIAAQQHERAQPFYVSLETDNSQNRELVDCVFNTLYNLTGVRIPYQHMGAGPWGNGNFNSVAWYVNKCRNPRGQVDVSDLWLLYDDEPWQHPPKGQGHHELVLLESDLTIPGANFVYGATRSKYNNNGSRDPNRRAFGTVRGTIQSAHRPRAYFKKEWTRALHGLLVHELGHFYGLADNGHSGYLGGNDPRIRCFLERGHCHHRSCIMEQVDVPGRLDLLSKVQHVERTNPHWFCDADLTALRDNVQRMYRDGPAKRSSR